MPGPEKSALAHVASAPLDTGEARTLMQARLAQFGRIWMTISLVFLGIDLVFYFTLAFQGSGNVLVSQVVNAAINGSVYALTRRRLLSERVLGLVDLGATLANATVCLSVGWAVPVWARPELIQLLTASDVLMLRAFLVPSTTRRTALLGGCVVLGIAISTALTYAGHRPHPDAPDMISYVAIASVLGFATVLLTSLTSRTIFGLRERVRRAAELGQYTLLEKIGEGGMGIVYKARHAMLRRPTAIKLLPVERAGEHNLARFEREVQMTSVLTHPNTISIYDYGRTASGTLYYAMEYLDGIDLDGLVAVGGPQPPERVIHLLRQICGALGEAHDSGLIHRDIKPANVLLCSRAGSPDLIKVVDFGLVKALEGPRDLAATAENQIVGTPLYLSPESIVTPDGVDARSDLYALGALAYFLLVGAPPFAGDSVVVVCGHHLHTPPVSPATRLGRTALQLDALILWCLEKSPDARPRSADALARALDACTDVPAWTSDQAKAWWQTHHAAITSRRERAVQTPAHGQTIAVDLQARPKAVATS